MEPEKKSNGALIGLVIIVIILIVGGVYMWQKNAAVNTESEIPAQVETTLDEQDSVDLDSLDKELKTLDTNIDANVINAVE